VTAKPPPPVINAYDTRARELAEAYESLTFEQVHEHIIDLLPKTPTRILDVGTGSGRDAAWFAYRGHEVVAVEPSSGMLREARERHLDPRIRWLVDSLPALSETHRLGLEYDFILAGAVWMHVRPDDRKRAFRKLVTLLAPSGRIAISLRLGTPDPDRTMYPVSRTEVAHLARDFGLRVMRVVSGADGLGRADVHWETLVLEYPDDDTGALPLLRHIVLRDDKSSTYKLALLRTVARVADSAAGMAREDQDGTVSLPLGLFALFWIRMMKPLVEADYPQTPSSRDGTGLGFVKAPFRALRKVAPFDLRPGMHFEGDTARSLIGAIRDASATICNMPAHYITYPGRGEQVFGTRRGSYRISPTAISLDEPFLRAFGEFMVPAHLWRTLARLNVWIEPVLLGEWIALMQQYAASQGRHLPHDALARALAWLDPVRDTRLARERAIELIAAGETLRCIWSGKVLSPRALDIDHCFPFSAWPCSDLWNLLPSSRAVNQREKKDKLVTVSRLGNARDAMLDWWTRAWADSGQVWRPRFIDEARASLPLIATDASEPMLGDVFEGVQVRRALLRQDQRLPEWGG
jgi:SAM-dependent methyltransferase